MHLSANRDAVLDAVPVLDGGLSPGGHAREPVDAHQTVRHQPAGVVRSVPHGGLYVRDELFRTNDAPHVPQSVLKGG